ncbi:MAG TPA: D-hexose-6-phosphate mutarotase [Gemmatirosa sp.]|nr:D-hexose-6-phosphate mutarotase [Gemmatirosa sp.]
MSVPEAGRRTELRAPDGAVAVVDAHGAHVLAWRPAGPGADGARERLFLSARASFGEGTAIRGGVPVIFPQFAGEGPLPKHGFARTRRWTRVPAAGDDAAGAARWRLVDDAATRAVWPHAFAAELTVQVGGDALAVTLGVQNTGTTLLAFTAALHTYLRVDDVARAAVRGLAGTRYRDTALGDRLADPDAVARAGAAADDDALRFAGEVDRIYVDAPPLLTLVDGTRRTRIESAGFPDAVVWNPGAERADALADLEPGGWRRFVCVEAAAVARPVRLAPGEHWTGTQRLTALT